MTSNLICINQRKIKHARLELKSGRLNLILPKEKNLDIELLIKKHSRWINDKSELVKEIKKEYRGRKLEKRSEEELRILIKKYVRKASEILKVEPNNIFIKKLKTKWGSCSPNKNLTFNFVLKYLPNRVIWYVVYHEMSHLLIPKHNNKFWYLIKYQFEKMENYERDLFGYWFLIRGKIKI
jgi:hypothetical protein